MSPPLLEYGHRVEVWAAGEDAPFIAQPFAKVDAALAFARELRKLSAVPDATMVVFTRLYNGHHEQVACLLVDRWRAVPTRARAQGSHRWERIASRWQYLASRSGVTD